MLESNESVQFIVDRVVERLLSGSGALGSTGGSGNLSGGATTSRYYGPTARPMEAGVASQGASPGLFSTVQAAVSAARDAQKAFVALPLATRKRIVAEVRNVMRAHVDELSKLAVEETGLGRVEDKRGKNLLVIE